MATSISLMVLSASRDTRSSASWREEDTKSEAIRSHLSYPVVVTVPQPVSVRSVGLGWGRNGVLLDTGHTWPDTCTLTDALARMRWCRASRKATAQMSYSLVWLCVEALGFETEENAPETAARAQHIVFTREASPHPRPASPPLEQLFP